VAPDFTSSSTVRSDSSSGACRNLCASKATSAATQRGRTITTKKIIFFTNEPTKYQIMDQTD